MPEFKDYFFDSTTGCNSIHVRRCSPEGKPKAIVQIAHGIAEHINRYDEFASFLASNGFLVVGNDHLGHGQSIGSTGIQGFFAANDGWSYVVSDMKRLHDMTQSEYPDVPYIMFGHSMGSFLTRTYLINYPEAYDLAIISGTGHQSKVLADSGYLMASCAVKMYGPEKVGTKLNNIAFGAYNKDFEPKRTDYDWLSRNADNVDAYINDPLCGFVATVSLFRDMMGGIRLITNNANIAKMNKDKPVYFMSGASDPVGENGKGVERAYKAFCNAGLKDVFMRLYPEGRHEMLNEINRDDVYNDILTWINSKLKQ